MSKPTLRTLQWRECTKVPRTDNLGTVRDLAAYDEATDTTTVVDHITYDSFGNVMDAAAVDHLFGYTGRAYDDVTGLQNNLNRWYDATTGRWISEDPIGFEAGDPNLYRYVGNSSTLATDPSGLAYLRANPGARRARADRIVPYPDGISVELAKRIARRAISRLGRIDRSSVVYGPTEVTARVTRNEPFAQIAPGVKKIAPSPVERKVTAEIHHDEKEIWIFIHQTRLERNMQEAFNGPPIAPTCMVFRFGSLMGGSAYNAKNFGKVLGDWATSSKNPARRAPGKGLGGNPFQGKTPEQIDDMFKAKGWESRGPNPLKGQGGYVNPRTGRSAHIDDGLRKPPKRSESPHVDMNRRSDKPGRNLPKKKFPLE